MSRLNIDIPEELHEAIKSEASLNGLSLRDYVLQKLKTFGPNSPEPDKKRFSDSGLAGLWAGRNDMQDPNAWVRKKRRGRFFSDSESDSHAD